MLQRLLIFFLIISLAGCVSSRKYLQRGQYDRAIEKAVKKLSRKPDKTEEIGVLKKAYRLAMEEDRRRIRELRMSGQPDVYEEIYLIYENMEARQDLVRRLPSGVLNRIDYKYVNFEQEKVEAQRKAAEYLYVHGVKLLASGSRFEARKAYNEFMRVKQLISNYKDVDRLITEALFKGKSQVLFTMSNQSNVALPRGFETELYKISLADLNSKWINYDTREVNDKNYHYHITLKLRGIMVSPEQIKQREFTEEKIVDAGWEYVLDEQGNVKKDSLGNDIKVKKTKKITARVQETKMMKHVAVTGRLEFIETATGQILKTDPVTAEWHFEHAYLQARGDLDALSTETRKMLGVKPVPFPPSDMMILNAATVLKEMTKEAIHRHRRLFQ